MFVVDTNILLYAVNELDPRYARAKNLIQQWQRQVSPWHSTWSVFYEFMRVATHPSVYQNPLSPDEAGKFLKAIDDSPGFSLLTESERHAHFFSGLVSARHPTTGNHWHDAHIVALMLEHGISMIYSCDRDFHRYQGIKVIDPLVLENP